MIPTDTEHPLHRDGTSQAARDLADLRPGRALLDDRRLDDLLDYLRQSAGLLVYYSLANTPDGDWEPFLARYRAVRLAAIAHLSVEPLRTRLNALLAAIDPTDVATAPSAGEALFQMLAAELVRINSWAKLFEQQSDYARALERAITTHLNAPLSSVVAAIKAVAPGGGASWLDPFVPQLTHAAWTDLNAVAADPSLAGLDASAQWSAVKSALTELIDELGQALVFLSAEAERAINTGGLETRDQPPHLGLILAYLRLFQYAQNSLNDLVRRHLEFYFRTVLQIRSLPAVMDRLYALFEPGRTVTSHRLEAGTRLYAGKDSTKVEIHFGLVRELIANQATVAELRSTFIDAANHQRLLAASVANSADGAGAALSDAEPTWAPFGDSNLPPGRRGFAIAAPVLRLSGGEKQIILRLTLTEAATATLETRCREAAERGATPSDADGQWSLNEVFTAFLTTPEGWLTLDSTCVQADFKPADQILKFTLRTLTVGEIVSAYDAAVHQRAFATAWPVVEISVGDATEIYPGDFLDDLAFEKIEVRCDVTDDLNLVVASDLGTLDAAKPFLPFGPTPTVTKGASAGSSFYVGSAEIFAKQLTHLSFNVEWKDLPVEPDQLNDYFSPEYQKTGSIEFKVAASYLNEASWDLLKEGAEIHLFGKSLKVDADALEAYPAEPELPDFASLTTGMARGFVKFTLTSPSFGFGHQDYARLYANAVVYSVKHKQDSVDAPNAPFAPAISRIAANYTAVESRSFTTIEPTATLEFYHIEPHGEWRADDSTDVSLIPKPDFDAAFFIGLEDFSGDQQISLLFHLADGSGNPFVDYPEVQWQFLAGDDWQDFDNTELLHDSTLSLRRTGLILFSVPAEATTAHTRMPAGRLWLRAVANGDVSALNNAYAVYAQAAEAEFIDQGNDLARLSSPLPAGSVSRLVTGQPQIKKVNQLLPSFAGEVEEAGFAYYRRVSERLRHRDRAITLWDYERLALQNFPDLHKVKCVNHTTPDSELAPGHVLIVVIPKLTEDAFNPLQPAVSQDVLEEIESFLQERATAFAGIKVVNPLYELVQVSAQVHLRAGYDTGFYETQIAEDVTRFLTPWAYGEEGAISFTAEIYPSTLLNFLDELEYVDYVTDLRVRQFVGGQPLTPDPLKLSPTTERSILVSHDSHEITLV